MELVPPEKRSEGEQAAYVARQLRKTLPWRVRFRLWRTRQIDGVACWLVANGHHEAACRLWRATGLWGG